MPRRISSAKLPAFLASASCNTKPSRGGQIAREEALVIVRQLSVAIEPVRETDDGSFNLSDLCLSHFIAGQTQSVLWLL